MWDKNQLTLKKYEEVYNQALVLTCISMKPSIFTPKSSDSSSLCSPKWSWAKWSIQQHNNTLRVLPLNHGHKLVFIRLNG